MHKPYNIESSQSKRSAYNNKYQFEFGYTVVKLMPENCISSYETVEDLQISYLEFLS